MDNQKFKIQDGFIEKGDTVYYIFDDKIHKCRLSISRHQDEAFPILISGTLTKYFRGGLAFFRNHIQPQHLLFKDRENALMVLEDIRQGLLKKVSNEEDVINELFKEWVKDKSGMQKKIMIESIRNKFDITVEV